jgi:hypothetical protein
MFVMSKRARSRPFATRSASRTVVLSGLVKHARSDQWNVKKNEPDNCEDQSIAEKLHEHTKMFLE